MAQVPNNLTWHKFQTMLLGASSKQCYLAQVPNNVTWRGISLCFASKQNHHNEKTFRPRDKTALL